MALNKKKLADSLKKIDDNKPSSKATAASKWAKAIKQHAQKGRAGDTKPTFITELTPLFLVDMEAGIFLDKLPINLALFWQTTIWSSASFTGVTGLANPVTLTTFLKVFSAKNLQSPAEDHTEELAGIIDSWTKTVMVVLTNNQSGATTTAPIL